MKTGVVYLTIKVRLNSDIEERDIPEFVNNLNYEITDETNLIVDTEMVDARIWP